jgi:cardiolipin synthase (CMP-forming)
MTRRPSSHAHPDWLNLANAISATRFPLAAAFIIAPDTRFRIALVALSAISDWVDGAIARRSATVTRTGELLDPIADRTFMLTAIITLAIERSLPLWSVPLLLLRDVGVVLGAGAVLLIDPRIRLPARPFGKRVTWLQFAGVALLLVRPDLVLWVVPPIALLGIVALVDYAVHARRQLHSDDPPPPRAGHSRPSS